MRKLLLRFILAPGAKRLSPLFSTDAAEREQRVLVLYAEPRGGRASFRWVKRGFGGNVNHPYYTQECKCSSLGCPVGV